MNILDLLDQKIEGYYQNNENYPKLILMSKDTKDKVIQELKEHSPTIEGCWIDKKNNYRGIKIELKKDIFIELKG